MKAILLVALVFACLAAYTSVDATQLLARHRAAKSTTAVSVKPGARKKVLMDVQRFQQPSSHECYTGAIASIIDYYAQTKHAIPGDGKKCRCPASVAETLDSPGFAKRKADFEAKVSRHQKAEAEAPAIERSTEAAGTAPTGAEVDADEEEGPAEPVAGSCPAKCDISPIVVGVFTDVNVPGHVEGHGAPTEEVLRKFGLLDKALKVGSDDELHQVFKDIRDSIKKRKPVVIGVMSGGTGHAVVINGYSYGVDSAGKIVPGTKQLNVIDPWRSEKDPYWVKFPEKLNSKKHAIFPVQQCSWWLNKILLTKPSIK